MHPPPDPILGSSESTNGEMSSTNGDNFEQLQSPNFSIGDDENLPNRVAASSSPGNASSPREIDDVKDESSKEAVAIISPRPKSIDSHYIKNHRVTYIKDTTNFPSCLDDADGNSLCFCTLSTGNGPLIDIPEIYTSPVMSTLGEINSFERSKPKTTTKAIEVLKEMFAAKTSDLRFLPLFTHLIIKAMLTDNFAVINPEFAENTDLVDLILLRRLYSIISITVNKVALHGVLATCLSKMFTDDICRDLINKIKTVNPLATLLEVASMHDGSAHLQSYRVYIFMQLEFLNQAEGEYFQTNPNSYLFYSEYTSNILFCLRRTQIPFTLDAFNNLSRASPPAYSEITKFIRAGQTGNSEINSTIQKSINRAIRLISDTAVDKRKINQFSSFLVSDRRCMVEVIISLCSPESNICHKLPLNERIDVSDPTKPNSMLENTGSSFNYCIHKENEKHQHNNCEFSWFGDAINNQILFSKLIHLTKKAVQAAGIYDRKQTLSIDQYIDDIVRHKTFRDINNMFLNTPKEKEIRSDTRTQSRKRPINTHPSLSEVNEKDNSSNNNNSRGPHNKQQKLNSPKRVPE